MDKNIEQQAEKRKPQKRRQYCFDCPHHNNADYCNGIGYWNEKLKTGKCWLK